MVSGFEVVLCVAVLAAAAISFNRGFVYGVEEGAESAIDILVEDGCLSRFVNDDGVVEVCSSGEMSEICPKCGFQEGDGCETPA